MSAQEDNPTASWVQMLAAHAIEPTRYARPGAIPNGSVKHAWTAAAGVVGRLAALGMAARVGRRGEIANALRADHDALAQHLALALLGDAPSARAPANSTALVPGCPPFTSELAGELISERWSPLDSHASGNWHRPTPSELELGRRTRGKALTGTLRDAGIRRVFVRASNFHAGTYTFRTTVRFLSAYADFRVVMGHTRRDRGIVLNLRGGDLGFATGRRDNLLELKTVRASLSDIRSFDGAVSPLSRTIQLRSPRDSFTVAVHVSGPFVRVLVDEQEALAYRRPTGAPIEGTIGFGLYSGLVAFLEPETQHHRVRGASRTCACGVFDEPLRFDRSFATPVVSYVGRRVPDLPRSPGGTLLLWYTTDTPKAHRSRARVKESIAKIRNAIAKDDLPVAIHVAFPSIQKGETSFPDAAALKLPPERLHVHAGAPSLREHVHDRLERYATSLEKRHSKAGARTRAIDRYLGRPVWIMIDDLGVIRAHGPDGSQRSATTLARRLSGW